MRLIFILMLALLLGACENEPAETGRPEEKKFMQEKFQALDTARGLEETLQQGADAKRRRIEDAGG